MEVIQVGIKDVGVGFFHLFALQFIILLLYITCINYIGAITGLHMFRTLICSYSTIK